MLSRRLFGQLCGVSSLSLCSGLRASDSTGVTTSRTIALDNDLFTNDIHRFFGNTHCQEFPVDIYPDSGGTMCVPIYMYQETITYKKKYENTLSIVDRIKQYLIKNIRDKIEIDMLSTLIAAGIEKGISKKSSIQFGSNRFDYIASPEAIHADILDPFNFTNHSNVSNSCLLGKVGKGRQDMFERIYKISCKGDLAIRLKSNSIHNRMIVTLPTLPPLIGFDTTFEFDRKTNRITEKPHFEEAKNSISLAYFCGIAVLDNRDVQLLDVDNVKLLL